jgi:hypothetical protein
MADVSKVPKASPAADPVAAVVAKYDEFGWTVFRQRGSINDLIVGKARGPQTQLHFVQVVTVDTADDTRFHGLAKNSFIQNAFSNQARPIHAHVVTTTVRGDVRHTVTFEDVNTASRVIVGGHSSKADGRDGRDGRK